MTISNTDSNLTYVGDGATTVFAYTFKILEADDLLVQIDGVTTTDYTVGGVGDAFGGDITFNAAPANDTEITIERVTNITQLTEYSISASAPFSGAGHEAALDKLTIICQDQQRYIDILEATVVSLQAQIDALDVRVTALE